jgi:hypothetical protein
VSELDFVTAVLEPRCKVPLPTSPSDCFRLVFTQLLCQHPLSSTVPGSSESDVGVVDLTRVR